MIRPASARSIVAGLVFWHANMPNVRIVSIFSTTEVEL
jgi:hypothetical protein